MLRQQCYPIPLLWPWTWPRRSNSMSKSWLWELPREASWGLRPSWYACLRDIGTISGTPSSDLEFDLDYLIRKPGQKSHAFVSCPGAQPDIFNGGHIIQRTPNFSSPAPLISLDPNLIRSPWLRHWGQMNDNGFIRCQGRLVTVWDHLLHLHCWHNSETKSGTPSFDTWPWRSNIRLKVVFAYDAQDAHCSAIALGHFGTPAIVISRRHPLPHSLTWNRPWRSNGESVVMVSFAAQEA